MRSLPPTAILLHSSGCLRLPCFGVPCLPPVLLHPLTLFTSRLLVWSSDRQGADRHRAVVLATCTLGTYLYPCLLGIGPHRARTCLGSGLLICSALSWYNLACLVCPFCPFCLPLCPKVHYQGSGSYPSLPHRRTSRPTPMSTHCCQPCQVQCSDWQQSPHHRA